MKSSKLLHFRSWNQRIFDIPSIDHKLFFTFFDQLLSDSKVAAAFTVFLKLLRHSSPQNRNPLLFLFAVLLCTHLDCFGVICQVLEELDLEGSALSPV